MENLHKENLSFTWLDDCVKQIYYFENVILCRANSGKHFAEQEIIDVIGMLNSNLPLACCNIRGLHVCTTIVSDNMFILIYLYRLGNYT